MNGTLFLRSEGLVKFTQASARYGTAWSMKYGWGYNFGYFLNQLILFKESQAYQ
jgi:hypothetical protein